MNVTNIIEAEVERFTLILETGTELTIQELPDGISITLENSTCHYGLIAERECDDVLRVIDAVKMQQWNDRKL